MLTSARGLVKHFKHSTLFTERLHREQVNLTLLSHQFIQDVATRWNSSFYLLDRLNEQKRAISAIATEQK